MPLKSTLEMMIATVTLTATLYLLTMPKEQGSNEKKRDISYHIILYIIKVGFRLFGCAIWFYQIVVVVSRDFTKLQKFY